MFGELPLSAAELEERQAATLSLSTGMYGLTVSYFHVCLCTMGHINTIATS